MFKDSLRSKPFGIIATVLILFSALSLAACGGGGGSDGGVPSPSGCVSGGPGTSEASPYVICTAADLAALAGRVNAGTEPVGRYYLLGDNIDLSAYGAGYNSGKGWIPIGNDSSNEFRGYLDGNGKTVSNLYINDSTLSYAGLFGRISSGYVKNTGINNANITGRIYVGGVAGYLLTATITNCYVTGKISGTNNFVGGIAGVVRTNSSIANSYATSEVSGRSYVGGIAGHIDRSSITNSYATGEVSGDDYAVGGITGQITGNNSDILRSYATGKVSGVECVGGIAGELLNNTINITDSYATGEVSGDSYVGGIAGIVRNNNLITSSYATGKVSGVEYVGGIVGQINGGYPVVRCAALNPEIVRRNGSDPNFGSVAGNAPIAVSNTVAWDGMDLPPGATGAPGTTLITTANAKNKDTYNYSLSWYFGSVDASPWKWGGDIGAGYLLPFLYWQEDAQILSMPMPLHLAP